VLVAVIVTWTSPGLAKVQDSVEIPVPVMVDGVSEQEVLLETRLTTPLKPSSGVIVTVEVPEA